MKCFLLGCAAVLAGCGGSNASLGDAATTGTCSAEVPSGQTCNQLTDLGQPIMPTCVMDPVPVGAGGKIIPGTYVLTDQIYYARTICPTGKLSATLVIAGDCVQTISGGGSDATSSGIFVVSQNGITISPTCTAISIDSGVTFDAPDKTFTATDSTFTLFTNNAAVGNPNPDRAAVFARR